MSTATRSTRTSSSSRSSVSARSSPVPVAGDLDDSKYISVRYRAEPVPARAAIVQATLDGDSLFSSLWVSIDTSLPLVIVLVSLLSMVLYVVTSLVRRQKIHREVKRLTKNKETAIGSGGGGSSGNPTSISIMNTMQMSSPLVRPEFNNGDLRSSGAMPAPDAAASSTAMSTRVNVPSGNPRPLTVMGGPPTMSSLGGPPTFSMPGAIGPPTMNMGLNGPPTFSVQFSGAGIGSFGDPIPQNSQSPPSEQPADTLIEYEAVLSVPGFLEMEFAHDVRLKGKMAEGGGGIIYKADLLNPEFLQRFGKAAVVVKVLKPLPHMSFADLKTIVQQEIAIMNILSHHPNIITLVGFTEEPLSIITKQYERNLFSMVMSMPVYANNTTEYDALKGFIKQDSPLKQGLIVKGFELLPEIAVHLCWGMASGMHEMHKNGILHRDLKSANVLLEYNPMEGGDKPAWMSDPMMAEMSSRISGMFDQNSLAGGVGWGRDSSGRPYCPVNPVVCDFGLAQVIKKNAAGSNPSDTRAEAVKGLKEVAAVGISYRYAAPEAFNRMYKGTGVNLEGKPVGK
eukprot:Partr_v1_DN27691_c3_g1_i6_m64777